MTDIINQPLKFLGSTVLSVNAQLGLGSEASSLNADLIEDCEANPPDAFNGIVGQPVYFQAGAFYFGGLLSGWTYTQNSSGKKYSITAVDPRGVLGNCVLVTDQYLGDPQQGLNYFNVYKYYEGDVLNRNQLPPPEDCAKFGSSGNKNDRGMPYQRVISALSGMTPIGKNGPIIYTPTGYPLTLNLSSFPQGVPEFYRVESPSTTIIELLEKVCDALGLDFYVYLTFDPLTQQNLVNIGYVDLKQPSTSFSDLIYTLYNGVATDISYGQQMRDGITKTVIFGEKQHYLVRANKFNFFFGEDLYGNEYVPIVPYTYDKCGFWINKKIDSLNLNLNRPIPTNGPYCLHERDIRAAMASFDIWIQRVLTPTNVKRDGNKNPIDAQDNPIDPADPQRFQKYVYTFADEGNINSLNKAIRDNWPELRRISPRYLEILFGLDPNQLAAGRTAVSLFTSPNYLFAQLNKDVDNIADDIQKIHNFIKDLGDRYYGKQFIVPLEQKICYYYDEESILAEKTFTEIPTKAGGWVDYGTPVLGLSDPALSYFRETDGRVKCFAVFNETPITESEKLPEAPDIGAQANNFPGAAGAIPINPPNPIP